MREERENECGIRDNMTFNDGTRDEIFRRERDLLISKADLIPDSLKTDCTMQDKK